MVFISIYIKTEYIPLINMVAVEGEYIPPISYAPRPTLLSSSNIIGVSTPGGTD